MSLAAALDAAAAKEYGPGYDSLSAMEKTLVREHVLPVFNTILHHLRADFAGLVDERALTNEQLGRKAAAQALRRCATDIRSWP